MNTIFLATVIGWYFVFFSVLLLFRGEETRAIMRDILGQRSLFFIIAIITLILGILMVVSHNLWVMGWPLAVTFVSWFVLLSALFRLFFLEVAMTGAQRFIRNKAAVTTFSIVLLLIGVFLLYNVYLR
ncbi:Integral membrane protein (PIN domain superfamily) (plasmid) [Legionella adelaidensis]|uniref:Integral membrane protein (PIN domain superfamily) n=1 Tax=Legionella adelaidensis TaxID=45056 RepID=A0A0W0R1N8_9GAMM|nr:hypothetical protein [Legionella adelaidensis]KTC65008.1 Integral membrane protein (PIN domain superfamily) [Legionella adelaidensis]VEH85312.1 Integral membrane protein (PIN domain superfamily) [Legionella adelaidensis]